MDKLGKYNMTETDKGALLIRGDINKTILPPPGPPLTINGAWHLAALPQHVVVELADGNLAKFFITPFRKLKESDFTVYKSHHPKKCKGSPLPDYLYRFYGLARGEESMTEVIRTRLSPTEKSKLEAAASNADKTVSEFLREYIRGL